MLIELYGRNFGCFRDPFSLSLLATDIDPNSPRGLVEVEVEDDQQPLRLLRSAAIYGPNGSGKSTVLRAARALRHLIGETRRLRSDSPLEPYEPFALDENAKAPVTLGVKAVIDRRLYDYVVCFDARRFTSERLLWLRANHEPVALFDRNEQEVSGQWRDDRRFALLADDFRPNALLLSLADHLAPGLAGHIAVGLRGFLKGFETAPWFLHRERSVARRARDDAAFGDWLLSHLRAADIGVVDLQTEEYKHVMYSEDDEGDADDSPAAREELRTDYRLSLLHRAPSGASAIPYHRESAGTQRLVELAPLIYDLMHGPAPMGAFVDELEKSLHPHLLKSIVRHFNCEAPPHSVKGQLIFATHETSLIDAEAKDAPLRRDQVYLTEKDDDGAARLYSVADFRERNNLNMRRRYLQGRYGALPSLGQLVE